MADPFLHMVRSMTPHTQEAQRTLHRKNKLMPWTSCQVMKTSENNSRVEENNCKEEKGPKILTEQRMRAHF